MVAATILDVDTPCTEDMQEDSERFPISGNDEPREKSEV